MGFKVPKRRRPPSPPDSVALGVSTAPDTPDVSDGDRYDSNDLALSSIVDPAPSPDQSATQPAETAAKTSHSILFSVCFAFVLIVWVVWRTGPGKIPNVEIFTIIADGWPTIPMGPETSYVLRVPLGQLAYKALPWPGTQTFLLVHFAALSAAAVILMAWFTTRLRDRRALVAGFVLLCAPITAVLLLWIGMYDAFSILAWCLVLFSLSRAAGWQLAAGIIAGVQNFEQVLVGIVLMLLLRPLVEAAGLKARVWWLLGGLATGKVGLEIYFKMVGATPGGRQTFLNAEVLRSLLTSDLELGPIIVWSGLAGLWGFALTGLLTQWPKWNCSTRAQIIAAPLIWFAVMAITADHTRVLAMTSFPLVAIAALVIAERFPLTILWRMPQWWMLMLAPPAVVFGDTILPMGIKLGLWGVGPF